MNVDFIIRLENGECEEEEIVEEFQKMINSGFVWQLQGSYGRMAQGLIDSGLCSLPKKKTYDYYGSRVS